ncbi:uncharacterized protein LOC105440388 [Strongylocentrotus purpuratus]|uniref:Uncharacterized protein n=1 Tax=Strongylocentrotus purpuratus TaxID=7668 RepID=A0A7M7PCE7_STRPU|nr:uncharacterized protein LOC105440388 [Strongylocentrotus purpuratus]|eukprot:XP_011668755.1 PREDICTED: uncharacterized protein LOC105440388 isoform X2 [Strongylocentrotus purpuratus]
MRRLVVSGSNTAKSATLGRVLPLDWATQNGACALSEKQFLFALSANDMKPNQTIENAIKNQLLPDLDEVDEALIRQLLNKMPDEIAILIDGANESNCGENIMDVLTGRTLQKVTVMVTTKPRFAKRLHLITPGGYDRIYMD